MISKEELRIGNRFSKLLFKWHHSHNTRHMPWKGEKDPYKIWISEIILQQTRVEQGLKYYQNFISAFPTIQHLADAPEQTVLKLWEGLGYYSRCRNLIKAARHISINLKGNFPTTHDGVLQLPGVGPYTAAAFVSFAFNLPYAVVDGNVYRVLARITNNRTPIDSPTGRKQFSYLAQSILPKKSAAAHNQAIMDFGATVCKPVPLCNECFFKKDCLAFINRTVDQLPVKEKKTKTEIRNFNYVIVVFQNEVAIQQRVEKDIWHSLYQFPLIESKDNLDKNAVFETVKKHLKIKGAPVLKNFKTDTQRLTHQLILFNFMHLEVEQRPHLNGYIWVKNEELSNFPFPRTLTQYLQTCSILT